ncbi:sulfotransferase [Sphingomonas oryzagri]
MSSDLIPSARAALQAGRLRDAGEVANIVLKQDSRSIDAIEILALIALRSGDRGEAETRLRTILSIDPTAHWARDDLARLLVETGRVAEAEAEARAIIAADPDHIDGNAMLGALLSERAMLVEGAMHLRRAIGRSGQHPQILINLGRNLLRQGALDEAGRITAHLSRVAPEMLAAAVLAVDLAEQSGDLAAAHRALIRAEAIAAREGRDVLMLRATLLSRDARWMEALSLLDGIDTLNGSARLLRGRLRDRAARYDEAWHDFVSGKADLVRASGRRYDREAIDAHFALLASIPLDGLPRALQREGPQPLFILGMPRSGTTMAEHVLASHSAIRAGGELPFTAELVDVAGRLLDGDDLARSLGTIAAADRRHVPAVLRDFYLARAETYGLRSDAAGLFTDKMPVNEIYLPLLRLAFPNAPMLRVRRHPLDTLVSMMMHDMTHGFDCGYRLEDAAYQLASVTRLVGKYRATIAPDLHDFGYERFVADQAGETDRLMAHLGLVTEAAQLRFHESRRYAPTPSYAQVREPVHDRSINRWKPYRPQLEGIIPIIEEAMQDGGYSL